MYKVESCVCDYAIYNNDIIIPELIFNSRKNAEKVCEIMNLDINHKVYEDSSKTVNIENVGTFDNRKGFRYEKEDEMDKKCSCHSIKSINSGMKCSNCGREL